MWQHIISFIVGVVSGLAYPGIVILMFLESSFFPFPSEIVMIPAGYLAAAGKMNLFLVIAFGILGSLSGAIFNYYLGYKLGRPFLVKYGRYMLLREEKLSKIEEMFNTHGAIITFIGRLLPGIRQYISFPPGITKMSFPKFAIFTSLGAGIWTTVLTLLGYFLGENQYLIQKYLRQILYILLIFSFALTVIYIFYYKRKHHSHSVKTSK